jgi:5-formyltetrahydrofolate cyclo-ligase
MNSRMPPQLQPSEIRQEICKKRRQLELNYQEKAANQVANHLKQNTRLQEAKKIGGYLAADGEVSLHRWFVHAWQQQQCCYLPVVIGQQLLFAPYHEASQLIPNQWGILEPSQDILIHPSDLEVVLVPLVAFDAQGNRLGRGAGYYDRSFAFLRNHTQSSYPYLIGIGYSFQQVPHLTPAHWDIPLHTVITEEKVLYTT